MDDSDVIQGLIDNHVDQIERIAQDLDVVKREIARLTAKQATLDTSLMDFGTKVTALKHAQATLQEHDNDTDSNERIHVHKGTTNRKPYTTQPTQNLAHRRNQVDPLIVYQRDYNSRGKQKYPKKRTMRYDGDPINNDRLKFTRLSNVQRERADLLLEILQEEPEGISQVQLSITIMELLECKKSTARSIVSDSIGILQHERKIIWTGEKVDDGSGRKYSPVWKIRDSATDHASAGIPTDDESQPHTTHWPTPSEQPLNGSHIHIESNRFEGKR